MSLLYYWLFLYVSVCPFTYCADGDLQSVCVIHTELQSATLTSKFSGLTVLLHRDCSISAGVWQYLLLLLQQFDHVIPVCSCTHSTRYVRLGLWERAARWDRDPGPTVCLGCSGDGRMCEWLWLQSELACHNGGGASVCHTLHLSTMVNVKLIKAH